MLDPYAKPPVPMREVYKRFQRGDKNILGNHPDLIDAADLESNHNKINRLHKLPKELSVVFAEFAEQSIEQTRSATAFDVPSIPGLSIWPALFPPTVQLRLLDKLLHRDLRDPAHHTNVHLHYDVPYPEQLESSYFSSSSRDLQFSPQDQEVHKPITTQMYLKKKLRWMTLGGQYDWTAKSYPPDLPPAFPADIKRLLERTFPMKAEAAIVNLYSPGDTLSLHRDVSEACQQPLVSVSLGCDGIFVAGLENEAGDMAVETLRLRSGDALLMSGESRYAWHGVPKIVPDTCPQWMKEWPCEGQNGDLECFKAWSGWMSGKRINLNVRQMYD